jgi:iron(II)-dependent oxidoreductase
MDFPPPFSNRHAPSHRFATPGKRRHPLNSMVSASSSALGLDLLSRWAQSREETDRLFAVLAPSALYQRPILERHRIVFYIGHLDAFDWNLLRERAGLRRFLPEFDHLFSFGIDPIDGGLPSDQPGDWPAMSELLSYRSRLRQELDAALANAPESGDLVQLINIAIEHRLMHAETLEYMFHQLPFDCKIGPALQQAALVNRVTPEIINIPPGSVTLGLRRDSGEFGWDNEFEAHVVDVPAFSIDKYKITNGQFLQFIEAGGYQQRALWPETDWNWKLNSKILHPVFWVPSKDGFHYRSMFAEFPLPLEWPVYVSQAEAAAYARWVGKNLPAESEWQRAAQGASPPKEPRALWDPLPVGSSPELRSAFGIEDLIGTGWEWTETPFQPFSGFTPVAAYPGYSANFFDGKHYVLKGGSSRTAACMLRKSFRNWFQAHYQYVYAGFRCVAR